MTTLSHLVIVLAAAAPLAATAQTPSQPQPQAQPQQVQITTLPQICRIREQELVAVNLQILNRNGLASREKDEAKRTQLLAPVQNLQAALREGEASWSRMDCARMLYGAR
jgi:hypothetical protein